MSGGVNVRSSWNCTDANSDEDDELAESDDDLGETKAVVADGNARATEARVAAVVPIDRVEESFIFVLY